MPQHACKACIHLSVLQRSAALARDGGPELQTAQTKLERAEEAMQRGDYVSARIFAEQAEVDAMYAWTLAENARLQRAAAERRAR